MSLYELKIVLRSMRPPVWRRLRVPGDLTLAELHHVLQVALGWTNSHLHEFAIGDARYGAPNIEDSDVNDERKTRLDQVATLKSRFLYEYDFGDGWEHDVIVEKITEDGATETVCTGGARACPPEDCGGAYGYENLLAALADKNHPEHRELREWVGSVFDPERFDVGLTNEVLRMETAAMLRRRRAPKRKTRARATLKLMRR